MASQQLDPKTRTQWVFSGALTCGLTSALAAAPLFWPPLPFFRELLGLSSLLLPFALMFGLTSRGVRGRQRPMRQIIWLNLIWFGVFAGTVYVVPSKNPVPEFGFACFLLAFICLMGAMWLGKSDRWVLLVLPPVAALAVLPIWLTGTLNPLSKTGLFISRATMGSKGCHPFVLAPFAGQGRTSNVALPRINDPLYRWPGL